MAKTLAQELVDAIFECGHHQSFHGLDLEEYAKVTSDFVQAIQKQLDKCPKGSGASMNLNTAQKDPLANQQKPVWELVIQDMKDRDKTGRNKYGTPLQPFNGRDALVDAYQEALDLAVYLRQAIEERKQIDDTQSMKELHYQSIGGGH